MLEIQPKKKLIIESKENDKYICKINYVLNYKLRLSVIRKKHKIRIYIGSYSTIEECEEVFNIFRNSDRVETLKYIWFFNDIDNNILCIDKTKNNYVKCLCGQSVPQALMNEHLTSKQHTINEIYKIKNVYDNCYKSQIETFNCSLCNKDYSLMYKNTHYKTKQHLRNKEKHELEKKLIIKE